MSSESARASSAAEARFRIDDANSKQRTVMVVALDAPSEAVVGRLAAAEWGGARFLTAAAFAAAAPGADMRIGIGEPGALGGRVDPFTAGDGVDLVALVATAGENPAAVCAVGKACRIEGATMIGFVLTGPQIAHEALSRTLARLRPWTLMLTIAEDEDCLADVLKALRA
jgi:hypothetical protein